MVEHSHIPDPIERNRNFGALYLGDILDAEGNPYCKKLAVDDIVYNPYNLDIGIILSWKDHEVKVNVYAAYRYVNPKQNCNSRSATEQPRLDVWKIRDFVIYSKVCRDSRHIFCQVSPFSRKYSHPFDLETYIKKHRPVIEEDRWIDKKYRRERNKIFKKTRANPFKSGA